MNYIDIDHTAELLIVRLKTLTDKGLVHSGWVDNIEHYGLLWEVTMSSGLNSNDIKLMDDSEFLDKVNQGMLEWDI